MGQVVGTRGSGGGAVESIKVHRTLRPMKFERIPRMSVFLPSCFFSIFLFVTICTRRDLSLSRNNCTYFSVINLLKR